MDKDRSGFWESAGYNNHAYGTEDSATVRGYYVLRGAEPEVAAAFEQADPSLISGTLKATEQHVWQVVVNGFAAKADEQAYTLLRMQPGPKWVSGKPLTGQDISAHFDYMVARARAGVVIAAGPDGSGQEGWYVVRGGQAVVDQLLADDPGVRTGVLRPVAVGWNVIAMQPL